MTTSIVFYKLKRSTQNAQRTRILLLSWKFTNFWILDAWLAGSMKWRMFSAFETAVHRSFLQTSMIVLFMPHHAQHVNSQMCLHWSRAHLCAVPCTSMVSKRSVHESTDAKQWSLNAAAVAIAILLGVQQPSTIFDLCCIQLWLVPGYLLASPVQERSDQVKLSTTTDNTKRFA